MSKFGNKSSSGKFGNSGKFGGGSGRSSGGFGKNRNSDDGDDRRSSGRSNNRGGGRGGDSNLKRVGSVTVAKSVVEQQGDGVIQDLKDSGLKLWLKFYLPKGTNSMTVTNDTKLLINFRENEKAPEFVVADVQVQLED
jgi:hypothetical protein